MPFSHRPLVCAHAAAGAALLGLEPSFVVARRSRLTYGVRCRAPWTVAFAESAAAFGYPQRVWRDEDGTIDAGRCAFEISKECDI